MGFRIWPVQGAVLILASLLAACHPPAPAFTSTVEQTPAPSASQPPVVPAAVTMAEPTAIRAPTVVPSPTLIPMSTAAPVPSATPVPAPPPPTSVAASSLIPVSVPAALSTTSLTKVQGKDLALGQLDHLAFADGSLQLARRPDSSYWAEGAATSPAIATASPFDNAVLSWNALAPEGAALRFEMRVRAGAEWSPWFVMGSWSQQGGASQKGQANAWGTVDVDTLELHRPATAWQYRVAFTSNDPKVTPSLRLLSLVQADLAKPLAGPALNAYAAAAVDLAVPAYSQLAEDPAIAREICSPTSLTMVLNYYSQNKRVADVAQAVRDRGNGIFGNWPLNTAYAGQLGFEAYVDRFYSADQLREAIAAAIPPIISIRFQPGELSNSPIPSTTGHLIVVRGFTVDGDIVVNDPIASTASEVRRVYKRAELERIWLRAGGVVYMIRKPA